MTRGQLLRVQLFSMALFWTVATAALIGLEQLVLRRYPDFVFRLSGFICALWLIPLAGLAVGFFMPLRKSVPLPVSAIFFVVAAMFSFAHLQQIAFFAMGPTPFHYRSETYTPQKYPAFRKYNIENDCPWLPLAREIELKGKMGWRSIISVSGRIAEKDFLEFCRQQRIDPLENKLPESIVYQPKVDVKTMKRYYSYRQYGVSVYDRDAQVLYYYYITD